MEIEKLFDPKEIPFTEFKNGLSAIASEMDATGFPVRVTRHGKPLFLVVPQSSAAIKSQILLVQRTLLTLNPVEHSDLIIQLEGMLNALRIQNGEVKSEEDFEKFREKMIHAAEASARSFQK
jgi:PHD/YefM family antitoxin component YafN of YafNO toxin-antitoxin module